MSNHHGHQIKIHTIESTFLYNNGKVYKSLTTARSVVAKIVNGIDAGTSTVKGFSYCEIIDWYSCDQ